MSCAIELVLIECSGAVILVVGMVGLGPQVTLNNTAGRLGIGTSASRSQ